MNLLQTLEQEQESIASQNATFVHYNQIKHMVINLSQLSNHLMNRSRDQKASLDDLKSMNHQLDQRLMATANSNINLEEEVLAQ